MHTVIPRTTTLKRDRTNEPNSGDKMEYLKRKKEKKQLNQFRGWQEMRGGRKQRTNGTNSKMVDLNLISSIITLTVITPVKKQIFILYIKIRNSLLFIRSLF